jgi:transposase-like protein
MITYTVRCRHGGSSNVIRHGKAPNGKQRFRCRDCTRTSRENPGSAAYDEARKQEIFATYHERTSLRGLTRIFGVSRTTVSTWLKKSPATAAVGTDAGASDRG